MSNADCCENVVLSLEVSEHIFAIHKKSEKSIMYNPGLPNSSPHPAGQTRGDLTPQGNYLNPTQNISEPLIRIHNLTRTYGKPPEEFQALRGVSLNIQRGENLAIIGKSGSGKSTLMHIIAGLDRQTSGEIWFDGQDTSHFSEKKLAQLRSESFGFIFQQFFLLPRLSVLDNILMPLKIRGLSPKQRNALGMQALDYVNLADKARNKATDLSGGQKQRVAIARALVGEPKILFADEPTGNLDSATGKQIIEFLFRINRERGLTLIVVTHDMEFARLFQRHIIIADGQIAKD